MAITLIVPTFCSLTCYVGEEGGRVVKKDCGKAIGCAVIEGDQYVCAPPQCTPETCTGQRHWAKEGYTYVCCMEDLCNTKKCYETQRCPGNNKFFFDTHLP